MKRWTIRILLMLTLGAVTTVGVAWGCTVLSPRHRYEADAITKFSAWGLIDNRAWFAVGSQYYIAAGLPLHALETEGESLEPPPLPVRPIIPGFIINTLFYAAIWFGLFFGFGALKRAIRRKRGRCLRCGYDLRGNVTNGQDARSTNDDARSTGCPECGWGREAPT